jgi:hypothetical protein
VVILWLAWHRRTLKKLRIGPASGEAPDAVTEEELARDDEVQHFMDATTDAVQDLDERLQKREERDSDA